MFKSVLSEKFSCNIARVIFWAARGSPKCISVWEFGLQHLVSSLQNYKTQNGNWPCSRVLTNSNNQTWVQRGHRGVHGVPVGSPRTNLFCVLSAELTFFGIIADVQDDQLGHPMLSMEARWGWDFEVEPLDGRAGLPIVSKLTNVILIRCRCMSDPVFPNG